ncbi:MAG: SRPBCC family protein [Thermodesulfobacteriota bacterium]|nr:SRPBCC family protein [Thermodesulfobacteriota bacterium]
MVSLAATVSTVVKSNQVKSFEHIVPIDLTSIFTGYGPLPAVTGTENQIGAWDAAGQKRTVHLSDGSSAQEVLTKYEHPQYFSYTVSAFTGILGFFTTHADGEWWFEPQSTGKTHIKWRYAFNSKSAFAVPALWIITKLLWRGYMKKALLLLKNQLEGNIT